MLKVCGSSNRNLSVLSVTNKSVMFSASRKRTEARPKRDPFSQTAPLSIECRIRVVLKRNATFESTAKVIKVEAEQISLKLNNISINIYQPPNSVFSMAVKFNTSEPTICVADLNSHNPQWGYADEDEKRKELVSFVEQHNLALIHDAKLPTTF